jgi:hypothetical protein
MTNRFIKKILFKIRLKLRTICISKKDREKYSKMYSEWWEEVKNRPPIPFETLPVLDKHIPSFEEFID